MIKGKVQGDVLLMVYFSLSFIIGIIGFEIERNSSTIYVQDESIQSP